MAIAPFGFNASRSHAAVGARCGVDAGRRSMTSRFAKAAAKGGSG
jgi:hypothetical protein